MIQFLTRPITMSLWSYIITTLCCWGCIGWSLWQLWDQHSFHRFMTECQATAPKPCHWGSTTITIYPKGR